MKNGAGYVNYLCMGKVIEADVIKKSSKSDVGLVDVSFELLLNLSQGKRNENVKLKV